MFSSSKIALALSFLALTAASPASRSRFGRRSGYSGYQPSYLTPQTDGFATEIIGDNGLEFQLPTNDAGTPVVSQPVASVGQFDLLYYNGVFLITPVSDPNGTAVAQANNVIVAAPQNAQDVTQQFQIPCATTNTADNGAAIGFACAIYSVSAQQCLQIGANPGDAPSLVDCTDDDAQAFNIIGRNP